MDGVLILLVGILVVASVCFATGIIVGRFILVNRNMGEALVAKALAQLSCPHVLINNVTLPTECGTTQIDHILVTGSGIFIIETKHYTGWILGNPNDSHWTQVIHRKKSLFQNPLRQNYGHIKAVQSLFKLPDSVFYGVVVFTGDAEFKTELGPQVIRLNELLGFVQRPKATVLDESKMTYVVGRIEIKRLRRSLETDEYHLNYVRRRISRA
jgi:restriction system protein